MVQMTEEERQLLQKEVTDTEDVGEALFQLRTLKAYLNQKYSDTVLLFHSFEPQTGFMKSGFALVSVKGHSEVYRAMIRREEDTFVCTDTLYGEYVREPYDRALKEVLLPFCGPVEVHTVFHTPAGHEISANTTLMEILVHEPCLERHTDLYAEAPFRITDELAEVLREGGFFGTYTVFCGDEKEFSDQEFSICAERDEHVCLHRVSADDPED